MSGTLPQSAIQRASSEWSAHVAQTRPAIRALLVSIVTGHRDDLHQRYLAYLGDDQAIADVFSDPAARADFADRFIRWLHALLTLDPAERDAFQTRQAEVGKLMSRIGLPAHALSRSMRKLKLWFIAQLRDQPIDRADVLDAMAHVIVVIDTAIEIREQGYLTDRAQQARAEEAYRLHALGQNLAMERERQRAALMDWLQGLLARLYQAQDATDLPRLEKSEFGLWFDHKAQLMFEGAPDLALIAKAIERIDRTIIPQFAALLDADRGELGRMIALIQTEVGSIKFALNTVFDARMEIENSRDPLTNLLNRRFLPTVLMREIAVQKARQPSGFCLVMLDVDWFKSINDEYGHLAGDRVLQQLAACVVNTVRPSDFVFRFGGEEIAIVLVDADEARGIEIAENLRAHIAGLTVRLADQRELAVTASFGLAPWQGELDYQQLLARADQALYAAKTGGRNRVEVAPLPIEAPVQPAQLAQ